MNIKGLAIHSEFIHRFYAQKNLRFGALLICFLVTACTANPPRNPENLCLIFKEKRDWHASAKRMEKRWKVPLQVPMAMMYQESSFRAKARPPKDYLWGFIPWGHVSSAYGYAQAKTSTWKDYKRETGNSWADRDDFDDAIDFMGWFMDKTHSINKVSKWDGREQYLNYHDGWGGYRKGTYKKKAWLMVTADKVKARAGVYGTQYRQCKKELDASWFERWF